MSAEMVRRNTARVYRSRSCTNVSLIPEAAQRSTLLRLGLLILACLAAGGQFTAAQSVGAVFPESKIQKTAESLEHRVKQSGDSANNGILEEKLDEMTRVAVRAKSGLAELHQTSEEVFFVISGHATLLTGGSIENPKGTEEIRGSSITGGTSLGLAPGDVVHIPRATPHQVLIEDGKTFTYVIIKILR